MLFYSIMRTTISLDDGLAKQVRSEADARGISMSAFIALTLDDALKRSEPSEQPSFRLITVRGGKIGSQVALDRPIALDTQEDEAKFKHVSR